MANPLLAKFLQTLKHSDLPKGWQDNPEIVEEAGRLYREMGTESPFFKAYEVEKGPSVRAYHSTNNPDIDFFQPSKTGEFGPGTYMAERPEMASMYGDITYPLLFSSKSPKEIKKTDWMKLNERRTPRSIQESFKKKGHDSIIGIGLNDIDRQIVSFDPTQIKSVFNRGTFDPGDPNILRQVLPYIIGGGAAAGVLASPSESEAANIGPKGFRNLFGSELTEATPGAFRGAEGMLRYEIPDNQMKLTPDFRRQWMESDSTMPAQAFLDDAISHPQLFQAYPQLREFDLSAARTPQGLRGAAYSDGLMAEAPNLKQLMDVIAHENQHGIQGLEGFAGGTTPAAAGGYRQYLDAPGEREARMVESRRMMTPEQRQASPQAVQAISQSQPQGLGGVLSGVLSGESAGLAGGYGKTLEQPKLADQPEGFGAGARRAQTKPVEVPANGLWSTIGLGTGYGRDFGAGLRDVLTGLTSLPDMVANPVLNTVNYLAGGAPDYFKSSGGALSDLIGLPKGDESGLQSMIVQSLSGGLPVAPLGMSLQASKRLPDLAKALAKYTPTDFGVDFGMGGLGYALGGGR